MVGLELPLLAMEHMYLLTEEMPEVLEFNAKTGRELVGVIDFKGEIYTRQERTGILLGTYEKACKPWSPVNTPWDFGHELLAPDLDRIAPSLEVGFRHFPALENAGIKQVINGPFTFAPDGNPLVGPVRGLTNYWTACAVMAGFSQGGGVGLALSNWMVHGDPGADIWGMDVARFGEWSTLRYTNAKVRENYSRRFSIRFPNEELPAARPQQTTPLYDVMVRDNHAVMGDSWGLETPLWFAPSAEEAHDALSFHRSNDFKHIGNEVCAVRERVGVTEIANFAKYRVSGQGAEAWLSHLMTNTMPKTGSHRAHPDAQRIRQADRRLHHRQGGRRGFHGLGIVGGTALPHALVRKAPAEGQPDPRPPLSTSPWSACRSPAPAPATCFKSSPTTTSPIVRSASWISAGWMSAARPAWWVASPIPAISATRSGWNPATSWRSTDAIKAAGEEFGIADFGMRALLSMRLEKNFPTWFRELRPIYGPYEAGMDRFIKLSKNDFIGREAAAKEHADGPKLMRTSFLVDALDADVMGDEPVWARVGDTDYGTVEAPHGYGAPRFDSDGTEIAKPEGGTLRDGDWRVVGWITSGGYAHTIGSSMAQGYIPAALATNGDTGMFEIEILGVRRPARIALEAPFDPNGERMRS
jgi:dimethylglycine dehydrogenase